MRCRKAKQLITLYVAPDPSWLDPKNRQALEEHLATCESCCRECRESREAISLLQKHWRISRDTLALMGKTHSPESPSRLSAISFILRAAAVAACLTGSVLGWWFVAGRGDLVTRQQERGLM